MKTFLTMNMRKLAVITLLMTCGGLLQAQTQAVISSDEGGDAISYVLPSNAEGVVVGNLYQRDQDLSKLTGIDKDIAILENVLANLFKGEGSRFNSSRNARGIHIPNTGVIFNIAGNGVFYGTSYVSWDDLVYVVSDGEVASANVVGKNYSEEELTKLNEQKEAKITKLAKTFLANYGSLLEDLKDNEKIQVSVDYSLHVKSTSRKSKEGEVVFVNSSRDENKRRMVAQVAMSDVRAYASGKLSEEQMFSKISIRGHKDQAKEKVDMKILANIFDELFNTAFEGQLYDLTGTSNWTYFEGFGMMYNVRIHTHRERFRSQNGGQVSNEDFNKKAEEAFPAFEKEIKESLIKYGRTVRSLKDNEVIVLNIAINSLRNAKVPKTLRMTLSKKDIEAYASGSKSLSQAIESIDIKRLSSKNSNSANQFFGSSLNDFYYAQGTASFPKTTGYGQN